VVRTLSPRLTRTLAVVLRRDKVLHQGLQRTIAALKTAAQAIEVGKRVPADERR